MTTITISNLYVGLSLLLHAMELEKTDKTKSQHGQYYWQKPYMAKTTSTRTGHMETMVWLYFLGIPPTKFNAAPAATQPMAPYIQPGLLLEMADLPADILLISLPQWLLVGVLASLAILYPYRVLLASPLVWSQPQQFCSLAKSIYPSLSPRSYLYHGHLWYTFPFPPGW